MLVRKRNPLQIGCIPVLPGNIKTRCDSDEGKYLVDFAPFVLVLLFSSCTTSCRLFYESP